MTKPSARTKAQREAELDEFFANAEDVLTDWDPGSVSDCYDTTNPQEWRHERPTPADHYTTVYGPADTRPAQLAAQIGRVSFDEFTRHYLDQLAAGQDAELRHNPDYLSRLVNTFATAGRWPQHPDAWASDRPPDPPDAAFEGGPYHGQRQTLSEGTWAARELRIPRWESSPLSVADVAVTYRPPVYGVYRLLYFGDRGGREPYARWLWAGWSDGQYQTAAERAAVLADQATQRAERMRFINELQAAMAAGMLVNRPISSLLGVISNVSD